MIRIITDSASDIKQIKAKELGITVLPMRINFDNDEYLDDINISAEDFFKKLVETDILPRTSQITPNRFIEEFSKYPNDDILCITMSSKLSGTYQSALLAKEEFDNVKVIDSENVTLGEQILVLRAIDLVKENLDINSIVNILESDKKRIKLVALLDTLEYLKKGGRISTVSAVFGTFLNIKPVIEVSEGIVKNIGKARGSLNGNNLLRKKINEYGGIDFSMPFQVGYSGFSDLMLKKYLQDSSDLYPSNTEFNITIVGSTIGTYVGPNAIATAFFSPKQ